MAVAVVWHAGCPSVEPYEEGAELAVHSGVVLKLDNFATMICWLDALSVVRHRGVHPATDLLLPHAHGLGVDKHHPAQEVLERMQQSPAYADSLLLILCRQPPPELDFLKPEIGVCCPDPPEEGVDCHTRLPQHLDHGRAVLPTVVL